MYTQDKREKARSGPRLSHKHANEDGRIKWATVALEAHKEIEGDNWATAAWLSMRPGAGLLYAKDEAVRYMYSTGESKS